MRIVNRFKNGDSAEKHLREFFFLSLGLNFEKIPENNKTKTPDGWVTDNGKKIALAEIKLIEHSDEEDFTDSNFIKPHVITIDKTIEKAMSRGKKQLKSISTKLPKILYLILDDSYADSRSIVNAAFGPQIDIFQGGKLIYSGLRGFHPTQKTKQDGKILGNWLSGIFCYMPHTDGYRLLFFKPKNTTVIPNKLIPTETIEETWEYSENSIARIR